jgi:hypothetical protein
MRPLGDAAVAHLREALPPIFSSVDAFEAVLAMAEERSPRFEGC